MYLGFFQGILYVLLAVIWHIWFGILSIFTLIGVWVVNNMKETVIFLSLAATLLILVASCIQNQKELDEFHIDREAAIRIYSNKISGRLENVAVGSHIEFCGECPIKIIDWEKRIYCPNGKVIFPEIEKGGWLPIFNQLRKERREKHTPN